jgi:uncharacterized RDD family membrane protein YckC
MPQEMVILTPENAEIRVPLAGMFTRAAAFSYDVCMILMGLIFILVGAWSGLFVPILGSLMKFFGGALFGIYQILAMIWIFGYFPFFELIKDGRTPGKKAFGLRVVTVSGQKLRLFNAILRNFLRIADFLPFLFFAGMFTTFVTERHQRIGDFIAGTIVIKEDLD